MTRQKRWGKRPAPIHSAPVKEAAAQCADTAYQLEPSFRTMVEAIYCAKYVINHKYPAHFIVRIKGIKKDSVVDTRLQSIINELDALRKNDNVEGYVFIPTVHAYRTAKFYVEKLYSKMGKAFPNPSFIPDGEGGLDIEWSADEYELTLSCRAKPEQEDFLYVKKGGIRYTELDLSSTKLYKHLKELNNA